MTALERLVEELKTRPPMTAAERHAQRRSWIVGEMMLEHPEMTREQADRLADSVLGPA